MRENTNEKYPRIIIWENVCGAFSSSKGEDFRQVLEQISKIKCENISIPKPQNGKMQDVLWEEHLVLHGESWMHNILESPKDVRESFLSQIYRRRCKRNII